MPKENFLLLSLKEDKAKKVAQVISNPSCRKILDYLAEKEATETEVAKKLNLPMSTVHYNLQQLMQSNLITVDEFHYSQKGKEVNHYKLANKYVIIAPKTTFGIKEKLRSILPVIAITLIVTGLLQFLMPGQAPMGFDEGTFKAQAPIIKAVVSEDARETPAAEPLVKAVEEEAIAEAQSIAEPVMESVLEEEVVEEQRVAEPVVESVAETPRVTVQEPSLWSSIAIWFFIGALFSLFVYLSIDYIRKKREK